MALQAGADIDVKVAEAIGVPCSVRDDVCWVGFNYQTGLGVTGANRPFAPSSDLNDAFFAAAKVKLFDEARASLQLWHCGWVVAKEPTPRKNVPREQIIGGSGSTPALAICRAIIEGDSCG